jgi:hemolysin activation/secretion protein
MAARSRGRPLHSRAGFPLAPRFAESPTVHLPLRALVGPFLGLFLFAASTFSLGQTDSGDSSPRFDILEYVIEGDTLLGPAVLERAVYPFLGLERTLTDAEGARRALQQAYQDAGFLSVSVLLPPQQVDPAVGEVRLVVQAAPVNRLRVTGAEHFLPSVVREGIPSLAPGSVPQFDELQEELAQLAALAPDRRITPILAAGSRPGTLDVELQVEDQRPLHGAIEINDKRSANTERGRLEAALSYDNLFQRGHSIALNLFTAPTKPAQSTIVSLLYSLPLSGPFGGPGDRLSLAYTGSDSDTPTPLGGLTVSRGDSWRLRWRDQLDAPDGLRHALGWGVTWRNLRDGNIDVAGFTVEPPSLRYTMLQLDYELDVLSTTPGRATRFAAGVGLSLTQLNAREVDCFGAALDQFECKRAASSSRFQVLSLNLSHQEPLGAGPDGWLLRLQLQGQYADTPLPSSEQAVYGGVDTVRGYLEGELAGDIGIALRTELWSPRWQFRPGITLRALGFFDRATLRRLYALPSEPATLQLGSAGLGVRLDTDGGLAAALDWASVIQDIPPALGQTEPSNRSASRPRRWGFSLRQRF